MRTAAIVALIVAFSGAVAVVTERPVFRLLMSQMLGASATVPPNGVNTWAQELAQREDALEERERTLDRREEANRYLMEVLSVAVGLIGALLLLNYYLDWRRGRDRGT